MTDRPGMTKAQTDKLRLLCRNFGVDDPTVVLFYPPDDWMMPGWVEVVVAGVTFGISPQGDAHS